MAQARVYHRDILMPHIDRLLSSREYPKTICPSEAPRALTASELRATGTSTWRDLMPEVRQLLWQMRQQGTVEILQKGLPVPDGIDLEDVKGPVRARKIHA
ncbi:hypothetical protein MMC28_007396 [Mycoblastus sanguinarius]|nr:hypothetical protein [Mycoblastus sanguinarius]